MPFETRMNNTEPLENFARQRIVFHHRFVSANRGITIIVTFYVTFFYFS